MARYSWFGSCKLFRHMSAGLAAPPSPRSMIWDPRPPRGKPLVSPALTEICTEDALEQVEVVDSVQARTHVCRARRRELGTKQQCCTALPVTCNRCISADAFRERHAQRTQRPHVCTACSPASRPAAACWSTHVRTLPGSRGRTMYLHIQQATQLPRMAPKAPAAAMTPSAFSQRQDAVSATCRGTEAHATACTHTRSFARCELGAAGLRSATYTTAAEERREEVNRHGVWAASRCVRSSEVHAKQGAPATALLAAGAWLACLWRWLAARSAARAARTSRPAPTLNS